jgi:hypothetical protein
LALGDDIENRFAEAVKGALDSVPANGTAGCPSPEIIAAYYEYSLGDEERARCERHFSECARCQGTLAALLRAAPVVELPPEAVAKDAPVEATVATELPAGSRWLRRRFKFAAPVAAAAVLVFTLAAAALHAWHTNLAREAAEIAALTAMPKERVNHEPEVSNQSELALNQSSTSRGVTGYPGAGVAAPGTPANAAPSAAASAAVPPESPLFVSREAAGTSPGAGIPSAAIPNIAPSTGGTVLPPAKAQQQNPKTGPGAVPSQSGASEFSSAVVASGVGRPSANPSEPTATQDNSFSKSAASSPASQSELKSTISPFVVSEKAGGGASAPAAVPAPSAATPPQAKLASRAVAAKHAAHPSTKPSGAIAEENQEMVGLNRQQYPQAAAEVSAPPRSTVRSRKNREMAMAVIGGGSGASAMRSSGPPPGAVTVSSPDHSIYWALESSGVIYTSRDGQNWRKQNTGVHADLLAGSAPIGGVCWAVGGSGTVLLTTDGVNWTRVKTPTTANLIGVQATSADVATVVAADGHRFSTFDGG